MPKRKLILCRKTIFVGRNGKILRPFKSYFWRHLRKCPPPPDTGWIRPWFQIPYACICVLAKRLIQHMIPPRNRVTDLLIKRMSVFWTPFSRKLLRNVTKVETLNKFFFRKSSRIGLKIIIFKIEWIVNFIKIKTKPTKLLLFSKLLEGLYGPNKFLRFFSYNLAFSLLSTLFFYSSFIHIRFSLQFVP